MDAVFWVGVFPGLTTGMLDFIADTIAAATTEAKSLPVFS
jgi:hypothetical protein